LSLAGVPLPAQFQGRAIAGPARAAAPTYTFSFRDRMDERYDLARAATDGRYRYIRNYYPSQPWGQHLDFLWRQASMAEWASLYAAGKLNAAQRAFFELKPVEELFDCANDPDNVRNLAGDPVARPHLLRLRAALRGHQLAIRDTGFMPEPLMIDWAAKASPAIVAADETRYPLARVLDTIDTLQQPVSPDTKALAAALRAPEAVIRYWAAVAALRAEELPDVTPLLSDVETAVRLAAAEAILRRGENVNAWNVIESALKDATKSEGRLFAMNVVARIPRSTPASVLSVIASLAKTSAASGAENYTARAAEYLMRSTH